MADETAAIAKDIFGDELYQERARRALPVLVRQAQAESPIFYATLAEELGMPNPRNLNFPLGCIGKTLIDLGNQWGEAVPPIQCLVINQQDQTPGLGYGWFMSDDAWSKMTPAMRRRVTQEQFSKIYAYPRWHEVLEALHLKPLKENFNDLVYEASQRRGGGEGEEHRRLKMYVARNPSIVGTKVRGGEGLTEKRLPSGDSLDVYFQNDEERVAVEVKPATSDRADLTRGIFQCVKYTAVLRAQAVAEGREPDTRAVLVLSGKLEPELRRLAARLNVRYIENVVPR